MIFHIFYTIDDARRLVRTWRVAGHRARVVSADRGAYLACRLA